MATLQLPGPLVSVDWLQQHLDDTDLVVFDASWHMPAAARNARAEWLAAHIKSARFFDFDQVICRRDSELPHMLPDAALFSRELQLLGLNQHSQVVIYDALGMFSSPRAWWMLRAMGMEHCALLDGGLPAWISAGLPVTSDDTAVSVAPGNFIAEMNSELVSDAQAVLTALGDETVSILDARPAARFHGTADEPRAGLRRGHMPGALNLPFTQLFEQGFLKPSDELEQIFAALVPQGNRCICSCGSGVTACVIAFAAHVAGYTEVSVYDGSWCEWGSPGDLPVVVD